MKLKLDENGHVVVQEGKPVYVHEDGKEVAFDAAQTVATISRLNGEAKSHREAKEQFEAQAKAFEGLDPVKVKEALGIVQNLDAKKLVDAGEVDKVKAEITDALKKTYEPQIQEWQEKAQGFESALHNELVGGGFARSDYIQKNIAVPVDMIQAAFGKNFQIENGKVVAVGADGQKIYSRTRPGEVADFDEALETLVGGYQHKESILKGSQAGGGGYQGGGGQNSGLKRGDMTAKDKSDYLKAHGQESYLKLPK